MIFQFAIIFNYDSELQITISNNLMILKPIDSTAMRLNSSCID